MAFSRSKKKKEVQHAPGTFEAEKNKRSKVSRWAIGIFAVLMALLMMIPSLSLLIGKKPEQTTIQSVADVDAFYQTREKELKNKLSTNAKDTETQSELAELYSVWANHARSFAQSDQEKQHATNLFNQSLALYDQAISNSAEAHKPTEDLEVNRVVTLYYFNNDAGSAEKSLQKIATEKKSPIAWLTLGRFYEANKKYPEAKSAYQSAISADPNDTHKLKKSAEDRLSSLAELQKKEQEAKEKAAEQKPAETKDSKAEDKK